MYVIMYVSVFVWRVPVRRDLQKSAVPGSSLLGMAWEILGPSSLWLC